MPLSKKRDKARKRIERTSKVVAQPTPVGQRKASVKRGLIYFMLDKESNAVKIGIAEDPVARLRDMQVGNPHQLTVVKTIDKGTLLVEKRLHKQFEGERLSGEWFSYTGALKTYLNNGKSNPSVVQPVQPKIDIELPNEHYWKDGKPNQDKLAVLRKVIDTSHSTELFVSESLDTVDVPVYNSKKHHEGDVVHKWSNGKWIEVTVPALDMDGNVIDG